MKINKKIIISIALIFITTLITMNTTVLAFNVDYYDPEPHVEDGAFLEKAGIVLGVIKYVGIIASVIVLSIIGIKYIFSSVEGKAEFKKAMLPYVLGCFLLVGISLVIGLVEDIATAGETSASYTEDEATGELYCDSCGDRLSTKEKHNGKCSCGKYISGI